MIRALKKVKKEERTSLKNQCFITFKRYKTPTCFDHLVFFRAYMKQANTTQALLKEKELQKPGQLAIGVLTPTQVCVSTTLIGTSRNYIGISMEQLGNQL